MRKLLISADMEGCGAVASQHALTPDRWEWAVARKWMTAEVVAVAEAAFAAGYGEVLVADSHGNAHNIEPDGLPDNVRLVRSWPRPLYTMQGIEDPEVEACALVGYHAGSMSAGGHLAHSFSGAALREVRLNGQSCSEGYLSAACAGAFGRPIILVSGDAATIEEAGRFAPDAVGFASKQALGWRSQSSLPPRQVCRGLREAADRALQLRNPRPLRVEAPFKLELEMTSTVAAELLSYLPNVERLSTYTVAATLDRIEAVMRFMSFVILYSPNGSIAL
jgi:D-amino peptidase